MLGRNSPLDSPPVRNEARNNQCLPTRRQALVIETCSPSHAVLQALPQSLRLRRSSDSVHLGGGVVERVDPDADVVGIYAAKRHEYQAFASKLEVLISDILKGAGIELTQVTSRCKTVESYREKVAREGKHYSNPITDVTDLVGVRVIAYYLEDVGKIARAMRTEFLVDEANSVDKTAALDPDRFGYESIHLVASLRPSRARLAEWAPYRGLRAEIQVRSLLQHAWAEISHKLQYKSSQQAPAQVRRQLYRLSALLELGDKEFSEVRSVLAQTEKVYSRAVTSGKLSVGVDSSSVRVYVTKSQRVKTLTEAARKAGFRDLPESPNLEDHIEAANARLVHVAQLTSHATLRSIDQTLKAAGDLTSVLTQIRTESEKKGFVPIAYPADVISMVLIRKARLEPLRLDADKQFKEAIEHALRSVTRKGDGKPG